MTVYRTDNDGWGLPRRAKCLMGWALVRFWWRSKGLAIGWPSSHWLFLAF